MYWVLLSTRDTVAGETPAFSATSRMVWLINYPFHRGEVPKCKKAARIVHAAIKPADKL
jgi:hypothetical protein